MQKKSNLNRMPLQLGCQKTNADIEKAKSLIVSPKTNFQNGIKKFMEWFFEKSMRRDKFS